MSDPIRTSYSALTKHRTCPAQWSYSYLRGLERIPQEEVKSELEFGNWWHALTAADAITRGREHDSLRYIPEEISTVDHGPVISTSGEDLVSNVLDAAEFWWGKLGEMYRTEWSERMGWDLPTALNYTYHRWLERWEEDRRWERPLAVEIPWGRELPALPMPGGEKVDPRTRIGGRLDEIYLDTRRGMIVVRDHKTTSSMKAATTADDMMDSQLQLYSWGIAQQVTEWGLGSIQAVAYDRVRSTSPKEPKITATGGLSKAVSDYDAKTYEAWATTDTTPSPAEVVTMSREAHPDDLEAAEELESRILGALPGPGRVWGKVGEFFVSGAKKGQPKFGVYKMDPNLLENLRHPDWQAKWFQRTLTPLNRNIVRGHLQAGVETAIDANSTRERYEITGMATRNFGRACTWCPFNQLCRAELIGGPEADGNEYDLEAYGLRERKAKA